MKKIVIESATTQTYVNGKLVHSESYMPGDVGAGTGQSSFDYITQTGSNTAVQKRNATVLLRKSGRLASQYAIYAAG